MNGTIAVLSAERTPMVGTYLICPPVCEFDAVHDIKAWIAKLKQMPQSNLEVQFALKEAEEMLAFALSRAAT